MQLTPAGPRPTLALAESERLTLEQLGISQDSRGGRSHCKHMRGYVVGSSSPCLERR